MNTTLERTPNRVRPTVALDMTAGLLRELLRTDLERVGFVCVTGGRLHNADVLVTDAADRRRGRSLTVRIGETEIEVDGADGTWWFPLTEIERLAEVLGAELARSREAAS